MCLSRLVSVDCTVTVELEDNMSLKAAWETIFSYASYISQMVQDYDTLLLACYISNT